MSVEITRETIDRYNRPGPRYTSYPTVPHWSNSFTADDYLAALADIAVTHDSLSVYVHLPFCAERCAYCGCNATSTRRPDVVDHYLDRIERELSMVIAALGSNRRVVQLHWGGGTPNFLNEAQSRRLMGMLRTAFTLDPAAEVALEVDPRIGSREQIFLFRELGFNRISFGVQDIAPAVQVAIGRIQPLHQTETVVKAARDAGFCSINIDLVYGLPYQTPTSFAATLQAMIDLRPDRIACFSYAHLPQARPNQKRVDARQLPTGYEKFQLFRQAIDTLTTVGYEWIGMDHFALASDELAVAARERRLQRNFMGYTVLPAPHQIGFGMSAIGDLAGRYVQNDAGLGRYQRAIDEGQLPIIRGMRLSDDDLMRRQAIMHLMCNLEVPFDLALPPYGDRLGDVLAPEIERIAAYAADDLVAIEPHRLRVTERGRFFIRNLAMELDRYLQQATERPVFSSTV
ncbi:MAG TPA: oxygen-independent coproporphyrinogen III oxidase [Chloroflexus aurantiacus]|uniref:Coproporphyrinogen-III oxidase n=1 Tax=Chloroflexus aurantiacus (strain ATCC 29366 / DSM 635 / J-10-fl) TaxID=324602 RepID=A9WFE6_CHLAA|nr:MULTISPECIES: oxygen-independent coproporphyrinogen III oxidase [Chloroflexus]ABY33884.1 oxygen-independent coproporphyrinogen III oxidase [Chloroflexus aurantiacus J-10-fl]RMG48219.1 MAG: oxygen-independent coproporphyrinogen III oxidase [Chloroflexota bacterium]GIV95318.1 MAG: coproporphyrinogen-III oxidase [Chloroflexus sp.]HBW69121.1 oxygen-independent coproporphyrinogen III oxidase [Chloroflexus aurantiacus]